MEKLKAVWANVRDNLWFLPTLFTLGGSALALLAVRVNDALLATAGVEPDELWWLFGGGSEAARSILEVIAGSIITVTGVVFSVTIIALQLTSTQFTPRVLRTFTADRGNQLVLGVFIGTFTYTLLVQRAVRASGEDGDGFVPAIAISVAILSAIVSIGFLIYFIAHTARAIQANIIIQHVTADTWRVAERLFAKEDAHRDATARRAELATTRLVTPAATAQAERRTHRRAGAPRPIGTTAGGYVQAIDEEALFELADDHDLLLRVEKAIGDFVLPRQPLLLAWPADQVDEQLAARLRRRFHLGPERTPHQDLQLGLIELVDIAVKALSPSINDPTTSITAVDRLTELLVVLAGRPAPDCEWQNRSGHVCLVVRRPSFDSLLALTFDQIRHHAAGNPAVMVKLINRLGELGSLARPEHRPAVLRVVETALRHAERQIAEPADRASVASAALRAQERIAAGHDADQRDPFV